MISPIMAVVDSSSTYQQVRNALADNASWIIDWDVEKAQNYVVAADVWLTVWAFDKSITGPSEMDMQDLNKGIEKRRKEALDFLRGQAAAGKNEVIHLGVRDFRD